ncbi:MAG: hypothetical protein HYY45_06230 [Deltaproteobacteria bacterium]|nr:hypothetical protein [Deltaproteobacteria bacterium]
MATILSSPELEVDDAFAAIELYYEKGWTDGLPVVPPTPARVAEFVEASGRSPKEILGTIPERHREFSLEKLAINAVMAGCLPEYMPVLVAAVEAMTEPKFNLHGSTATTGNTTPLLVVNGPIAKELGMNWGVSLFGPGYRSNATIGRAIRLLLTNVGGCIPVVLDNATFGHPGKYTYCIAENEENSPWIPLHVEMGYPKQASTVTVFAAEGPHHASSGSSNPEDILNAFAYIMSSPGVFHWHCEWVLIIGQQHMNILARGGWTKDRIRHFIYEKARRKAAEFMRLGGLGASPHTAGAHDPEAVWQLLDRVEDLFVLAGGGAAGPTSVFIPPWRAGVASRSVTREIKRL